MCHYSVAAALFTTNTQKSAFFPEFYYSILNILLFCKIFAFCHLFFLYLSFTTIAIKNESIDVVPIVGNIKIDKKIYAMNY